MFINNQIIHGAIFDLDGVLVDTAKYHFLAWKRLAGELGFSFSETQNEALKGVSRMASLEILLQIGNLDFSAEEKERLADKKNRWYVEYLHQLTPSDVLESVLETLMLLKGRGLRLAIGSASKNTPLILQKTGLTPYFDAIIDGNSTSRAKPDPEVFLLGAKALGLNPDECMVFEDSAAGIIAANSGNMLSIYLGDSDTFPADLQFANLTDFLASLKLK